MWQDKPQYTTTHTITHARQSRLSPTPESAIQHTLQRATTPYCIDDTAVYWVSCRQDVGVDYLLSRPNVFATRGERDAHLRPSPAPPCTCSQPRRRLSIAPSPQHSVAAMKVTISALPVLLLGVDLPRNWPYQADINRLRSVSLSSPLLKVLAANVGRPHHSFNVNGLCNPPPQILLTACSSPRNRLVHHHL